MTHQWVVPLESRSAEKQPLLGGKGAGLAQMWHLGIPTLPGFVVTTEAWKTHTPGSRSLIPDLWEEVKDAVANLEKRTSNILRSPTNPLIVSVRSSPLVSMPGQLRTVLNVGVNAEVAESLAVGSEDPSFASEVFARLIQMYGETVHRIPRELFSAAVKVEEQAGLAEGRQALTGALEAAPAVDELLAVFRQEAGEGFPQDPYVQLERSIA